MQQRTLKMEDMQVLAAFFVTLIATIGGLVELAVWRHWPIFFGQLAATQRGQLRVPHGQVRGEPQGRAIAGLGRREIP